jgi:hypothetical protein
MPRHLRVLLFDRRGNQLNKNMSSVVFPLTVVVRRARARDLILATNGIRQAAAAVLVTKKTFGAALVVCPKIRAGKHMTPTTSYLVSFAAKSGKHVVVGSVSCRSLMSALQLIDDRMREILIRTARSESSNTC